MVERERKRKGERKTNSDRESETERLREETEIEGNKERSRELEGERWTDKRVWGVGADGHHWWPFSWVKCTQMENEVV